MAATRTAVVARALPKSPQRTKATEFQLWKERMCELSEAGNKKASSERGKEGEGGMDAVQALLEDRALQSGVGGRKKVCSV